MGRTNCSTDHCLVTEKLRQGHGQNSHHRTTGIPYTDCKLKIQSMIIIFGNVEEKIIS